MLPIDSKTGKLWDTLSAQAKIKEIRAGINDDLRKRDAGHGIGPDGIVYVDPSADDPDSESQHVTYEVDQAKAKVRSTGGEHIKLLKSRWALFCNTPQDEATFMGTHHTSVREHLRDAAISNAESVEASLVPDRPKRGRPPGSKTKTAETTADTLDPVPVGEAATQTVGV